MSKIERVININGPNKGFCSNTIYIAKYTIWTFLPKFLFEQFRRYDNLFFAFISAISLIPDVSPTGKFITIVPLTFILFVAAIKEIVEDVRRHREDDKVNLSRIWELQNGKWEMIFWKDVKVGSLVQVTNELHTLPADLVLLISSDPSNVCYLETSNLDGESNLKIKHALTLKIRKHSPEYLTTLKGEMTIEPPNSNIYQFTGTINITGLRAVIGPDQFLPRGTSLQNTDWIIGIVAYTGKDSKLARNAHDAPLKQSSVDKITNRYILFLFATLLTLSSFTTIACMLYTSFNLREAWYLGSWTREYKSALKIFLQFLTSVILFNTIIPISLPVQLQIVRVIQSLLMESDLQMYDKQRDRSMYAKTSNLNEELGMVNFVFSDKTGTLTQNSMIFKTCSVAGEEYELEGMDSCLESVKLKDECKIADSPAQTFFRYLALCHTVIPVCDPKRDNDVVYQAASPDEAALVVAAKSLGMVFTKRGIKNITVIENGEHVIYERLHTIEFDSFRKRMSVIIRQPDGIIKLLIKGADNVIYDRLSEHSDFREATMGHLNKFANLGYRTLCIAERVLDEETLSKVSEYFVKAANDNLNRSEHLEAAANLIEKDLYLLGATAIEDRLQDKVPETISSLMRANMSVWMLTGDKLETALSIGYSTKLIQRKMSVYIIKEESIEEVKTNLESILVQRKHSTVESVLVVSGLGLTCCLKEELNDIFLDVSLKCKTVICCRACPKQKSDIVELIRLKMPGHVTLAIGDGANDVGMIQAAHVGIGIHGVEGSQAACSSDYSISQFRFLKRLLLVHGSWNYHRLTKMIFYCFYKNMLLYVIAFWYTLFCAFSGTMFFERWSTSFYNLVFSSLGPFAIGIFEKSHQSTVCMNNPSLYLETQCGKLFDFTAFLSWIFSAMNQSIIIFFSCYLMMRHDIIYFDGKTSNLYVFGNVTFTVVLITIYLKMALHQISWSVCVYVSIFGSFIVWIIYLIIMSNIYFVLPIGFEMIGMAQNLFSAPLFYICITIVPGLAIFADVTAKLFTDNFVRSFLNYVKSRKVRDKKFLTVDKNGINTTETTFQTMNNIPFTETSSDAITHCPSSGKSN